MTMAPEGGAGSASRSGRSLPQGNTRYPLYRRLGGPQGRSGQARKISPPTGIRSPDRPARSQSPHRLRYPANTRGVAIRKLMLKKCVTQAWEGLSFMSDWRGISCSKRFRYTKLHMNSVTTRSKIGYQAQSEQRPTWQDRKYAAEEISCAVRSDELSSRRDTPWTVLYSGR